MGVDELILLEDDAFNNGDSWSTAYTLSMAIKKICEYDIILCGRQSADCNAGQVGIGIAEMLAIPSITLARKIDITDNRLIVDRIIDDGCETVETDLPALVTVSNEIGEPRYPTIRGIMASKKIEPTVWKSADIDIESFQVGFAGRRSSLIKLFKPIRESKCDFISGDSPEDAAVNLAEILKQEKLL
jgi:electron transfer flavoprotein beta subunit